MRTAVPWADSISRFWREFGCGRESNPLVLRISRHWRYNPRASTSRPPSIHLPSLLPQPRHSPRSRSLLLVTSRRWAFHTELDADENRGVVIISEATARRFWPGRDAIGSQLWPNFPTVHNFYDIESGNRPLT